MPEIKRRDLIIAAGAAASSAAIADASAASAASRGPLVIDTSSGTPTLPKASERYTFPLTSVKPTVTTAGGTVTELTEKSFPAFRGNSAAVFYLVLKPGALREPHWHPNAWEIDVCLHGKGELGVVTPDAEVGIATLSPGDIGFIPRGWAHYIRNPGHDDMRFAVIFNNSLPNDIGLSTMFGGMPTNTFTQTLGVPASTLDAARKSAKTLLIVQRRG